MPPTSAWWAREHGVAARDPRDEGDVREVRAARVRVVDHVELTGLRVARQDGGDRLGHRAEVHGDVLGLDDHPALLVEERGRAVPPLLDVGREGGADERRAHLLGDGPELRAENLELNIHCSRHPERGIRPSLTPTHPGGIQQVAPSSSSDGRAATRRAAPRPGTSSVRPGRDLGRPHGDELDRPVRVRVAVALLVRPVEALREVGAERHGQLERLARGSGGRPRPPRAGRRLLERAHVRATRGRAARRWRRARARRARRPPRARARCRSRAPRRARRRAAALRRRTRRARSRADRDRVRRRRRGAHAASRRSRSRSTSAGSIPAIARSAASRSSSSPPASVAGSRPSRRLASVTVGRLPPLP